MTPDGAKLKLIRQTHALATDDWKVTRGDLGETLSVIDDVDKEWSDICTITALNPADAQIIRCAPDYIAFLLDLLDRSFAVVKDLQAAQPAQEQQDTKPDKDYTTNCAIRCGEGSFIQFLQDRHNLLTVGKESVAEKVRELCQISSRKQLSKSMEKANNWLRLNREFEGWMRSRELTPS